ncbi:uncharacterized protein CCOS01_07701, partial [Colletotrichum costaricense]
PYRLSVLHNEELHTERRRRRRRKKKSGRRRATALLRTMTGPEAELDQNRLQARPNQRRRGRACKSAAAPAANARHAASSQDQELERWLCVLGLWYPSEGKRRRQQRQQQRQQSTGIDGVCRSAAWKD